VARTDDPGPGRAAPVCVVSWSRVHAVSSEAGGLMSKTLIVVLEDSHQELQDTVSPSDGKRVTP